MRHHKLFPALAGVVHAAHHTRPDLERLDDRCLLSGVLPAGSLDPSFALGTGYVLNPNLQTPSVTAIQSDGSVLVGSVFNNPFSGTGTDFQITRYTSAGQLDLSFGVRGQVVTDFAGKNDQIEQILIDKAHGTFYAVGEAGASGSTVQVGIARYTMDGKLDPTFGMGRGKITTSIMNTYAQPKDYVETAALDSQGKLIVAGMATGAKSSSAVAYCANFVARFGLVGVPDLTFGSAGKVLGPVVPMVGNYVYEIWSAATVVPATNYGGASIVTVGTNNQKPEVCQFTLSGAMVTDSPISGTLGAVAFAPGGTWFASATTVGKGMGPGDVQLSAYTIGGAPKFPTVTVNLASQLHLAHASPVVNSVAIDLRGRIVLAGEVTGYRGVPGTVDQALLMRFTPGGQLDTAFGPQGTGVVTTNFGPGADAFTQVVIQNSDSKIVAVGHSKQILTDMVLARYLGEPLTITGAGGGGQAGGGLIAQAVDPSAAPVVSSLPIDPLVIEPWSVTPRRKAH